MENTGVVYIGKYHTTAAAGKSSACRHTAVVALAIPLCRQPAPISNVKL